MEVRERAAVLKQYECYCYQIAYQMLNREDAAVQAASYTLVELGGDDTFFAEAEACRLRRVKTLALKKSLGVYLEESLKSGFYPLNVTR
jgi:hypothetical protein